MNKITIGFFLIFISSSYVAHAEYNDYKTETIQSNLNCDQSNKHCFAISGFESSTSWEHNIYLSDDSGYSWQSFFLPDNFDINPSIHCDNSVQDCWAGTSSYSSDDSSPIPFVLNSKDGGKSWLSVPLPIKKGLTYSEYSIDHVHCSIQSGYCSTFVTFAENNPNSETPILKVFSYVSFDGQHWKPQQQINIPQTTQNIFEINHLCDEIDRGCVSHFVIESPTGIQMLVFKTGDWGSSWSTASSPNILKTQEILYPIQCDSTLSFCYATKLNFNSENAKTKPEIYYSLDGGDSWQVKAILPLPKKAMRIFINDLDCEHSSGHCLAVGGYETRQHEQFPISYYSNDNGLTWTLSSLPLPNNLYQSNDEDGFTNILKTVKCSRTNPSCIALGHYSINKYEGRILNYVSNDSGVTWVKFENGLTQEHYSKSIKKSASQNNQLLTVVQKLKEGKRPFLK